MKARTDKRLHIFPSELRQINGVPLNFHSHIVALCDIHGDVQYDIKKNALNSPAVNSSSRVFPALLPPLPQLRPILWRLWLSQ